MNNLLWIKIEYDTKYYRLTEKLYNIGINIYEIKNFDNYLLIKISYEDYEKLKKYLKSYNISIFSYTGIKKLEKYAMKNFVFFISLFIGVIILLIVNNMIFKIEIKTNNKEIYEMVNESLKENNIKVFTLKKRHKNVEKIVEKILQENEKDIEWLEIVYDGLKMKVLVTEKIKFNSEVEYKHCNVVASSSGKIISMNVYKGDVLKEVNDYVNKGDILITGEITHNEEVKDILCAKGEVYGEVWYKIKVSVPFVEEYKEYTGKNRYNFQIKTNNQKFKIFKDRLKSYEEKYENIYKLNDFEINFVKEKEYIIKNKKLSEEEAYEKAFKDGVDKIQNNLSKDEEILVKKVLKKSIFDSTIYLELFVVTKEEIGKVEIVEE